MIVSPETVWHRCTVQRRSDPPTAGATFPPPPSASVYQTLGYDVEASF